MVRRGAEKREQACACKTGLLLTSSLGLLLNATPATKSATVRPIDAILATIITSPFLILLFSGAHPV